MFCFARRKKALIVSEDQSSFAELSTLAGSTIMKTFIVLFFLAAALHYFLFVPLMLAAIVGFGLWLIWRLKYIILAILGLDMLFNSMDQ